MLNLGIIGKYTSINDAEELVRNPFLEHLNINERMTLKRFKKHEPVTTNKITSFETVNELTEQNEELHKVDLEIVKQKIKGTSPFILLYSDCLYDYKNMSSNCFKTLHFIWHERLNLNIDSIMLNPKDLVEILGMSKNTAYSVFVELLNNSIIRKRNEFTWWINPNFFYRGNRLNIVSK